MTVPDRAIHAALAMLDGQWVEAVDPAPRPVLVTSGAAVLRGALRIPTGAPTRDDARVLGAHLAGSALAADGSLSLHLADADGSRPLPLTVDAPWDLALPDGAGLTAAAGGRVTARPAASGPRRATPEAMAEWASTAPDAVEQDVLVAADDDWVTPADVVSALVERGVCEPREIARRSIPALARLVARGDLRAGSIGADGFVPSGDDPASSIEHLAALWTALGEIGRMPGPGQIAWFDLTDTRRERLRRATEGTDRATG